MSDKRVLLIIGGGVAAYKSLELIRLLGRADIGVRAILTAAGAQFVTPLSVSALSGEKVHSELFDLTEEAEMGHIELSRSADLVVVAPATADLMAKAAHGLAGDLATTTLLATDKPVLMAPAMNVRMWLHPATQRNLATLRSDGVTLVGPDVGAMACGEFGPGRMAEPQAILDAILQALAKDKSRGPLTGRKVLVTAGPTHEPIDPVRYIANRSSGRQGYAIAAELAALGAEVVLVSGPTQLAPPPGVRRIDVQTAREMLAACEAALPVDAAVMVAAVADWRTQTAAGVKVKKAEGAPTPTLTLVENPDILAALSAPGPRRPALMIGFAAETNDLKAHAGAKLVRKGCDWIVANDVSGDVMGGAENAVSILTSDGVEDWPRQSKDAVARALALKIAQKLNETLNETRGQTPGPA